MFKSIRPRAVIGGRLMLPRVIPRLYHSQDHASSNNIVDSQSIESIVFNKSMENVPRFGFDSLSITQAIRDLGYPDSLESGLTGLSNGNNLDFQLMLYWLKSSRQRLVEDVLGGDSEFHKISNEYERVKYMINKRLEYNQPIISKLGHGMSLLVVPYNIPQSIEELHNLSDDIAYYSGDLSNDFAWYSKRFSFSSVYVSSELYMLQDSSENFEKTKEFVNNKVDEVKNLGYAYNSVEQWSIFNAFLLINLIKSQLLRG